MNTELLLSSIEEAHILGILKNICSDYMQASDKNSLRNIMATSTDQCNTIKRIAMRKYEIELDDQQANRLLELVKAFLKKSEYRKRITEETREELLKKQEYKCAFCGKTIDITAHADHIVPFKYVGDELENNLQMLCENCNEKKNDSLDYQIRFLLKIV